jgi:hypothetical protein
VLITSFSDSSVTDGMADKLPDNVKMWFSNNVMTDNPRVTAVPIGLRTSPKGEDELRLAMGRGRLPFNNLIYMNFIRQIKNGSNPRRGLYEQFGGRKYITTEGGFDHVPMEQFYQQIASHPYVLSPPGAGPDCHRHWEAILLGAIPIVKRSKATKILEGLPCCQVDEWSEVEPVMLKDSLTGFLELFKSPRMKICWFEYWEKKIMEASNG